jgi:hypothetical protein
MDNRERKVYEDHPQVELIGLGFLAYYNVLGVHRQIARRTMERCGIAQLEPDSWYRRQILLDVLREVDRVGDAPALFRVGKELAMVNPMSRGFETFAQYLEASPTMYPRTQRNLPEHDFIRVERDGAGWLYNNHTPWPSQFSRGYLREMAQRLQPDRSLRIELVQGSEDSFARTFRLSWQE